MSLLHFLSKTKQIIRKILHTCDTDEMKRFKDILHNCASKRNVKYIVFKWDMKYTIMQLGMYRFPK